MAIAISQFKLVPTVKKRTFSTIKDKPEFRSHLSRNPPLKLRKAVPFNQKDNEEKDN